MVFRVCVFGFVILFICSPANADPDYIEACDAVFSPEAIKMSCCEPTEDFVKTIAQCRKESCSNDDELTCSAARCVLAIFGILSADNSTLVEAKVRAVNKKLIKENPKWKPLLDEEEKRCLKGQHKQYAADPACDVLKYLTCSYVSHLMSCPNIDDSPCFCKKLGENVATCKPHLKKYLKYLNKDSECD